MRTTVPTDFPVFVPHEDGHLAAWVTVPGTSPTGLVLMLPGASLDETIGSYLLFERAAPLLASYGLASVRMDYFGLGESTLNAEEWPLGVIEPAVAQAEAVLATVTRGVRVDRFAVLSLCYGGRVGLRLVTRNDCVGVLCLAPPIIEPGRWTALRKRYGHHKIVRALRANTRLRRLVLRPLRSVLAERRPAALVRQAVADRGGAEIAVLFGRDEIERDHHRRRATRTLTEGVTSLNGGPPVRVEVLPTEAMAGFDLMSPEEQQLVLDAVIPRLARWFGSSTAAVPAGGERCASAASAT